MSPAGGDKSSADCVSALNSEDDRDADHDSDDDDDHHQDHHDADSYDHDAEYDHDNDNNVSFQERLSLSKRSMLLKSRGLICQDTAACVN